MLHTAPAHRPEARLTSANSLSASPFFCHPPASTLPSLFYPSFLNVTQRSTTFPRCFLGSTPACLAEASRTSFFILLKSVCFQTWGGGVINYGRHFPRQQTVAQLCRLIRFFSPTVAPCWRVRTLRAFYQQWKIMCPLFRPCCVRVAALH